MGKDLLSRRDFLKGTAAGALGVATLGIMSACASETGKATESPIVSEPAAAAATEAAVPVQPAAPDETLETDIVVIGVGAAGLMSCIGAADKGARVIGVDRLANFDTCNNAYTAGLWVSGSEIQAQYPYAITEEEAFKHIYEGTNYQSNAKLLRKMVKSGGRAADILWEYGLLANGYDGLTADSDIMSRATFF